MDLATIAILFVAIFFVGSILYGTKLVVDIEH